MNTFLVISSVASWIAMIAVGFLLLGTLRALGLVQWRLDQLEATRPSRINREGLTPGRKAPRFTLPRVDGGECSLADYAGKRVLLVFVQSNCGPCHQVVPALNRLHRSGEARVLAINNAEPEEARRWAEEVKADFPVLAQDRLEISKKYQVFATPFAFVVDERGMIASSGIVNNRQHVRFVLDAAADHATREAQAAGHEQSAEPEEQPAEVDDAEEAMKITKV